MGSQSKIEWTEASWNPVTGCDKISDGCQNCYASRMAMRLHAMGNIRYKNSFSVTLHDDLLELPLLWKKPRRIFVNSMSDLFHEQVPKEFIENVFRTMNEAYWHSFQILTKRTGRMVDLCSSLKWTHNIWMGATIENNKVISRINDLKRIPASIRFLSLEPLLGPISELNLSGISWVIVGGESGPKARPMEAEWVRTIRDICLYQKVPFFFKQWGGTNKKLTGRLLDGKTWDEYPRPQY
ncbi:MAG: phage Gp37/Gp68 family protein [Negativicutes bacterium]|nr:phage Gp37/Gp68 family protein [Negativicutes bacterium]